MTYPTHLSYTKDHEWIHIEGEQGTIGVTKYALDQLGDVVYLELPKVGAKFNAHETFGTIESTKTVSDLYAPVACEVVSVNQAIVDAPEKLVHDAYKEGWFLKVRITKTSADLLTSDEYLDYIKNSH